MKIRKVNKSDINWIVKLHRLVLPKDELPKFGVKFMIKLYTQLLEQPDIKFICFDYGFGIFSLDRLWFEKVVFKKLLGSTILSLLIRPYVWPNILNYLFGNNIKYNSNAQAPIMQDMNLWESKSDYIGEIAFLAIDPKYQNKGWGIKICEEGMKYKDRWIAKTKKKEVRYFYQKLGFTWIGTEKRMGQDYYVLYLKRV